MGLVRAGSAPATPPPEEALADRRRAARALGTAPGAEAEIAKALQHESDPSVRAALFQALVAQATPTAAATLAALLRSDAAAVRNGALEALTALPDLAGQILAPLLADPDPAMRIFAVLLAGDLPLPMIETELLALLHQENDVNVCAAVLEVVLGTGQPLPADLATDLSCRFQAEPFVRFLLTGAAAPLPAPGGGA